MASSRIPGPIELTEFRFPPTGDSHESQRLERASRFQHHASPALDQRRESGWRLPSRPQFTRAFLTCGPPRIGLSADDYRAAAATLGIDADALKRVDQVEIDGAAFDAQGRPAMRFESQHFHRHTAGRFDVSHPRISSSGADGHGSLSVQYDKLQVAYDLEPVAALKSAAWGRFQVMGSSHRLVGCATLHQFVLAMAQSEAAHLTAFVCVVQSDRALQAALRANDWAGFSKRYRG